jgi:hypothetical protein
VRSDALAAADKAQEQFGDAKYLVFRNNTATVKDFQDAVNDPCTRAFWVFGHGAKVAGTKTLDPAIEMTDGFAGAPDSTVAETIITKRPAGLGTLNNVTLQSCGSFLPLSWGRVFNSPNAQLWGWKTKAKAWEILRYQRNKVKYPEIDPSTGQELMATSSAPGPDAPGELCGDDTQLETCSPLAYGKFGSQSFNFYATDGPMSARTIILGATVADDVVTLVDPNGIPSPTFEVTMTNDAIDEAIQDPSAFGRLIGQGDVSLTLNATSLSSAILFNGFQQLLFSCSAPAVGGVVTLLTRSQPPADSLEALLPIDATVIAATIGTLTLVLFVGASWYGWRWKRRQ